MKDKQSFQGSGKSESFKDKATSENNVGYDVNKPTMEMDACINSEALFSPEMDLPRSKSIMIIMIVIMTQYYCPSDEDIKFAVEMRSEILKLHGD